MARSRTAERPSLARVNERSPLTVAAPCGTRTHFAWCPGELKAEYNPQVRPKVRPEGAAGRCGRRRGTEGAVTRCGPKVRRAQSLTPKANASECVP